MLNIFIDKSCVYSQGSKQKENKSGIVADNGRLVARLLEITDKLRLQYYTVSRKPSNDPSGAKPKRRFFKCCHMILEDEKTLKLFFKMTYIMHAKLTIHTEKKEYQATYLYTGSITVYSSKVLALTRKCVLGVSDLGSMHQVFFL